MQCACDQLYAPSAQDRPAGHLEYRVISGGPDVDKRYTQPTGYGLRPTSKKLTNIDGQAQVPSKEGITFLFVKFL